MRSPSVIHAVGTYGTLVDLDFTTGAVRAQPATPTRLDLHSVFGDASGRLHAVGGNLGSFDPPTYQGLSLYRGLGEGE